VLRRAPLTAAVGVTCLLLAWAGEPISAGLAWERAAILHGELWRLLSGHLVHYSVSHAGADALVLLAMGLVAEPAVGSRRFAIMLGGGAALVSLGLLALAPALHEYRGASALAVQTAVLGGVLAWQRHPASRPMLAAPPWPWPARRCGKPWPTRPHSPTFPPAWRWPGRRTCSGRCWERCWVPTR
jgi:membrane associated rhomboid family serine protease